MNYLTISIQDLGKAKAQAIEDYNALNAKAESEGRLLTAEEDAQADALFAKKQEIETHIERRAKTIERNAKFAESNAAPAATAPHASRPALSDVKAGYESDPKAGFKDRKEFMSSVMMAGMAEAKGRTFKDERLSYLNAVGSDEHTGSNDAYGGFTIPEGFMGGLMTTDPEIDPIASLVNSFTMSNPIVKVNARVDKNHSTSVTGGMRVFRTSETNTVDPTRTQFEQITFQANTIMGLSYASAELLADSPISFAQIIGNSFAQEMASKIIDERINGTGTGQFEGVLNTPSLITVAKESGQAADTITFANITKMYARLWKKAGAVWLANHNTLPTLMNIAQQVGTAGVPAWQTDARSGSPGTLLGLPVYFTEACPTLGDLGDLILADWSQYLQGTLQGVQGAESMHVRFIYNENAYRFTMRNDGRSWWRSVLTPKNGDTLSPFVTLAAR